MGIFRKNKRKKSSLLCEKKLGGFTLKVHFDENNAGRCFATIDTDSGIFNFRFGATSKAYGFMLHCLAHGIGEPEGNPEGPRPDFSSIEAFVYYLAGFCEYMISDTEFTKTVTGAMESLMERRLEKGASEHVDESEQEQSESIMADAIEYANMGPSERAERKRQMDEEWRRRVAEEPTVEHEGGI